MGSSVTSHFSSGVTRGSVFSSVSPRLEVGPLSVSRNIFRDSTFAPRFSDLTEGSFKDQFVSFSFGDAAPLVPFGFFTGIWVDSGWSSSKEFFVLLEVSLCILSVSSHLLFEGTLHISESRQLFRTTYVYLAFSYTLSTVSTRVLSTSDFTYTVVYTRFSSISTPV